MKHLMFSPYSSTDPKNMSSIIELQQKVFKKFHLEVEHVAFTGVHDHAATLSRILFAQKESWDFVTFFDADCVPISHETIPRALEKVKDRNTIYGNVQASNVFDSNIYKTPPFIAPHFLTFSYEVWQKTLDIWSKNRNLSSSIFSFTNYPNPDGFVVEADVAEVFTREHEKHATNLIYSYPVYVMNYNCMWNYGGQFGFPKFKFGPGTIFESLTYHNYQIRIPNMQKHFFDYCEFLLQN
jgi:hypothetical protein